MTSQRNVFPPDLSLGDDDQEANEPPEPPRPEDPADVAGRLLLARALAAADITAATAGKDGSVAVVEIPAPVWREPVRRAWQRLVRGGSGPLSSELELRRDGAGWVAWASGPGSRRDRWDPDMVGLALSAGYHCVGIAADTSDLPEDLLDAADHRLTVPPLAAADVIELVRTLCNTIPAKTLSEDEATALTPRLLRLARRPRQSADEYVRKLREVLARVQAARTKAAPSMKAPRDAPTLERLHGMTEAVAWGQRLAAGIAEYRAGKLPWSEVDRGLLLSGPPGCGKTLFARALAATCTVPLFSGSYGQWLGTGGGHQGSLLSAMRHVFADAKKAAPAILFIDEVDSFPNRATIRHRYAEWDTQVVNALLAEIDGVEDRTGVVLIAACNLPWKLDPALVRSGRLDRHIRIGLPGAEALSGILREHLHEDLAGEDLSRVALRALGSNGADCERAVRGARQRARLAKRAMALADLIAEFDGDDERTPEELRIAATHEAGHAVVGTLLRPGSVRAVSLRSYGDTGGATVSRWLGSCRTIGQIESSLAELLAGRAAEEAILGIACTGAGGGSDSDLARATGLAAAAVGSYGLVAEAGTVWLTGPDLEEAARLVRKHAKLAGHVRTLLDAAHDAALHLVERHRASVEAVAEVLLSKRILIGAEVETIVRTLAARREVAPAPGIARPRSAPPPAVGADPDAPSPAHPSN